MEVYEDVMKRLRVMRVYGGNISEEDRSILMKEGIIGVSFSPPIWSQKIVMNTFEIEGKVFKCFLVEEGEVYKSVGGFFIDIELSEDEWRYLRLRLS